MLHAYTLSTSQIDAPELAVRDVTEQLAAVALCQNSVGILACHYDFVEGGAVEALRQALPFPLVGITTFYQATPAASGLFELTITVLTSNDVCFALASSAAVEDPVPPAEKVRHTYQSAFGVHRRQPALVLSFLSAHRPVSGDEYLRQLDAASGGVPSFGFVDSGEDETGTNTFVICDGKAFSVGIAMLLLIGDVDVQMVVSAPAQRQLLSLSATVTKAEGSLVREINNQPAAAYLKKNGIDLSSLAGEIAAALPFYCRMPGDEFFVARLAQAVAPDGSITFLAEVPQGSLLRAGSVTSADILEEACDTTRRAAAKSPNASVFLIGSCVGRFITLGLDTTAELDCAAEVIPKDKPTLACYVGGEICAVETNGRWANRFHNSSFIVLALR